MPSAAVCNSANCSSVDRLAMNGVGPVFSSSNDILGLVHVIRCAMDNEQELVGLQGHVILHDAVLWNTDAYEAGAHSAHSPNNSGAFKTGNDPGHQRTSHENRPETRYSEHRRSEQQSPKSTPERAHFAPVLHAVAGVVVTDHVFVSVCVSRGNREALHVDTGLLQFLDGVLRLLVRVIDCYY